MSEYVAWTQSGLTDGLVTVDYYEGNVLNVTVSAQWVIDDGGEVPIIISQDMLWVTLECTLWGMQFENMVEEATMKGEIVDAFIRELGYLIDNPEPLSRAYGVATRINALPTQKLMLYKYYKEQIPEKEIPVIAKAYDPITRELKGTTTFYVTVINVWNDGTIINQILEDHAEWREPYA